MKRVWGSLRVQLAVFGFLAIYLPLLLVVAVSVAVEAEVVVGSAVADEAVGQRSPWLTITVIALGPVAAGSAWWLAGRAVRPIDRIRRVAEDIEGSDLARRIGHQHGPTEVAALAAAFDAMLDRLQQSADTQRRLVEEASHELRTPLAVVITTADVVLAHPEPTVDVYRENTERMKVAAERMHATIDALLADARSRARTLDRRPADLAAIARDVADQAQALAQVRPVDVSVIGPAALTCSVDEVTMRRALANLVDNAVRFAPDDSTVTVSVAATETHAAVTITDHGPGIPAADQPHILERFWTSSDGTGTGLGLPIADHVARAHGGHLTVVSPGSSGDGCEVTLAVPRGRES